jgi:hypothetical protein
MKTGNKRVIWKYGMFGLIIGALILFAIDMLGIYIHKDDWKEKTRPLSNETKKDLCVKFSLTPDNPLCDLNNSIYGPDFYETITTFFQPYWKEDQDRTEASTYDVVTMKIGAYNEDCSPYVTTSDGFSYFRCNYDLKGDGVYILGFSFSYPDSKVFRIYTPLGDN